MTSGVCDVDGVGTAVGAGSGEYLGFGLGAVVADWAKMQVTRTFGFQAVVRVDHFCETLFLVAVTTVPHALPELPETAVDVTE